LDYTFEQYTLDTDHLDKLYDHIKTIEAHLIQYCMHLAYGDDHKHLSARVAEFNYAIMQFVQSAKMLKDISHNIEEIVWSEKPIMQQEAARFAGRIRNVYVDVMDILNLEEHSQQYMKLLDLFRELKTDDRKYILTIQDMVSNDEISTEELSDLLRVHRYVYNSSKSYLLAVRELIISKKERILMEKQIDKDVDAISPSSVDDSIEESIFQ